MGILYITECTQLMPAGAPGGLGRVPQEPPSPSHLPVSASGIGPFPTSLAPLLIEGGLF